MNFSIENSVKVFLRIRPINLNSCNDENCIDESNSTDQMIVIDEGVFTFDRIFYAGSSQLQVFEAMVEPQIEKLIQGFNCSFLAYGQSGAGKTSTVGLDVNHSGGMVELAINKIFQKLSSKEDFKISVSFLEIYNEKVFDLLSENHLESVYIKGSKFQGSSKLQITNTRDAHEIVLKGSRNRHVRATKLNSVSSRSHAIFSIFVTTTTDDVETSAVMHVCDLAGSEGLRYTQHTGIAQKESVNINRGLLAVSQVVQALRTGKSLIPYRDSVLTVVMQESLNIQSYITILGCISPARKDKKETMSTIRFAQSVKALDSKNIPEYNAYLKKQENARTPLRSLNFPYPSSSFRKSRENFKTPIDKNRSTARKRALSRENLSVTTPALSQTAPLRKLQTPINQTINGAAYMHETVSSIDNTMNELNFSTSTELDAAPAPVKALHDDSRFTIPSFSPFMRKIETTIDTKFFSFMKTFEAQQQNKTRVEASENDTFAIEANHTKKNTIDIENSKANSTFDVTPSKRSRVVRRTLEAPTQQNNDFTLGSFITKPSANICLTRKILEATSIPAVETSNDNKTLDLANETVVDRTLQPAIMRRRSARISIIEKRRASLSVELKEIKKSKSHRSHQQLSSPKPISKTKHKQNILALMNTGKFKELTVLPTIGCKTAYQIITHRSVNGKFKSLDELKSLAAMKGKRWQNFIEANMLV